SIHQCFLDFLAIQLSNSRLSPIINITNSLILIHFYLNNIISIQKKVAFNQLIIYNVKARIKRGERSWQI
ncbi:hypothetical protein, partial [Thomasclavelia cocleata]|uniref:hypothetical protein n=1 Tax=Thomasclavelia cocleata TaxID=69824 RepID=UPI002557D534